MDCVEINCLDLVAKFMGFTTAFWDMLVQSLGSRKKHVQNKHGFLNRASPAPQITPAQAA
jgi:hypothetical protein